MESDLTRTEHWHGFSLATQLLKSKVDESTIENIFYKGMKINQIPESLEYRSRFTTIENSFN